MSVAGPATIAVVLKGYPRLSETFIAQELRALELAGLTLALFSLRHPTDDRSHPVHAEIEAPVTYLPEYLHLEPLRVLAAWRKARRRPGYRRAFAAFLRDLKRDPTRNRLRRFGQACVLAESLPTGTTWLYAHFLHTPASVTRYAALMRELPWSASAHAKDIWTTPDWEKAEKIAELSWLATCTRYGWTHLRELADRPEKIELAYHGLDLNRFPPPPDRQPRRDRRDDHDAPLRILSVGRAVEKKGYEDLLPALAALPAELEWQFVHIGGGERLKQLKAQAEALGIFERVSWLGAQDQTRVIEEYRKADLFVLASRIAEDGDRDGLPNVLMEAQSQGLPCIATDVSAIPELIEDGVTGILTPPGDSAALSEAIGQLLADAEERDRLGQAGYERLRANFSLEACIEPLKQRFGLSEEPPTSAVA